MCSGSEAGSYLIKLIDIVYHSSLGLRVIMNKSRPHLPIVFIFLGDQERHDSTICSNKKCIGIISSDSNISSNIDSHISSNIDSNISSNTKCISNIFSYIDS